MQVIQWRPRYVACPVSIAVKSNINQEFAKILGLAGRQRALKPVPTFVCFFNKTVFFLKKKKWVGVGTTTHGVHGWARGGPVAVVLMAMIELPTVCCK
jgi:hypothetical protein